ncbi:MAG: pilus assembly protein N-terminal domain-containing protein [Acidobacteria bacterium]|nr:pilus assembly protein N-terminal domain-containing protein [Acidobacteriota bacterium]
MSLRLLAGLIATILTYPALGQSAKELSVMVGKSLVVDSPVNIQRVSLADGGMAEALVTSPRELIIHGKAPGQTSLIVWQQGGNRLLFDLNVLSNNTKGQDTLDAIKRELDRELKDQPLEVTMENGTYFVRGTVKDISTAERAMAIVRTAGAAINLLHVEIPPTEAQILLQVKFADVDRGVSTELGTNLFSMGATNTIGSTSTGQFQSGRVTASGSTATLTVSDALNIFLLRPDLNLGGMIKALQGKRLLQILAEPNVLTSNGKTAAFLSGGEFPFPTLQGGGGGLGAVTIQFREFGIRITFTPTVTPRGTIRLQVAPEVSSLDYANALTFQGFTIPGIASRKVTTEIELEPGQSFAIAGLLDDRTTESLARIPGLGDIPFFGRLFRTRSISKSNSELLVIVTPEFVRPQPADKKAPMLNFPQPWLDPELKPIPRHPGMSETGPVPVTSATKTMRIEDLLQSEKKAATTPVSPTSAPIQFMPVQMVPAPIGTVPQAQVPVPPTAPAPAPAKP